MFANFYKFSILKFYSYIFLPLNILNKQKHTTMKFSIKSIFASEILDSRGNPTVSALVELKSGDIAEASVPSGASTGQHEAIELRDSKNKNRFFGKGVLTAVENIEKKIAPALIGKDVFNQAEIDSTMLSLDGTANKSNLGANAILAVSLAVCKVASKAKGVELFNYIGGNNACVLPLPMMNVINGGAHSDAPIDFQEFMIAPVGAKSIAEAIRMGAEVFHSLKNILKARKLSTAVGDEGGFAPNLSSNEDAIEAIALAVKQAGYKFGSDIAIALDVASSEFFDCSTNKYIFSKSNGKILTSAELVDYLKSLKNRYPIYSIEDGCAENDWAGWKLLTSKIGNDTQLVGDDLFVTNSEILQRGISEEIANAILIKPNQIGSLTETLATISLAKDNAYACVVSHRSGETEDTFLADLAVGVNAGQIKTGSLSRSERTAKYNRLMRIERILANKAIFWKNA